MGKTLKEWRELRGFSREDLAKKLGFQEAWIERWEEVGFDVKPGSSVGDAFLDKLMDALDAGEGMAVEYVPDSPEPGDLIITPNPGAEALLEEIIERGEELNLRMAVPDEWGQTLRPPKDLSEDDHAAIQKHFERERAYSEGVVRRVQSALELLGGNSGDWKDGQTAGERLEEMDRELSEDLEAEGGAA